MSTLAINGGPKAVPDDAIKVWPPIDDVDREYVMASLENPNHAHGPNCGALAENFAKWNGNKHAITTNSGTAALHMAVVACGVSAGDEVIVTAYSWSSSATCILHHNAIPVFVDIDYRTINIDVDKIEQAITEKTKAIIVVHLHGLAVEMDKVMAIARKHNLKVIEDACQAHGATFNGKKTGTLGDCAAFSLNQNKCLCGGEGGIFVTNDDDMFSKALMLWSFGEAATPSESRDYHAYALGWMYRNSDLAASFALAQLTKMDSYAEILNKNSAAFMSELESIPGLTLPFVPARCTHNHYNIVLRVDPEAYGYKGEPSDFRDALVAALQAEGVGGTPWQQFILPQMTVFRAQNAYGGGCPWSCKMAKPRAYNIEDYPAAMKHLARNISFGTQFRAPNGEDVSHMLGAGVKKVFSHIKEVPGL